MKWFTIIIFTHTKLSFLLVHVASSPTAMIVPELMLSNGTTATQLVLHCDRQPGIQKMNLWSIIIVVWASSSIVISSTRNVEHYKVLN